jgi:hypothetical protein
MVKKTFIRDSKKFGILKNGITQTTDHSNEPMWDRMMFLTHSPFMDQFVGQKILVDQISHGCCKICVRVS